MMRTRTCTTCSTSWSLPVVPLILLGLFVVYGDAVVDTAVTVAFWVAIVAAVVVAVAAVLAFTLRGRRRVSDPERMIHHVKASHRPDRPESVQGQRPHQIVFDEAVEFRERFQVRSPDGAEVVYERSASWPAGIDPGLPAGPVASLDWLGRRREVRAALPEGEDG